MSISIYYYKFTLNTYYVHNKYNSVQHWDKNYFWNYIYLSKTSCSNPTRSQAMYSRAASVTRGHQDKSKICNFGRFSAISSIPSSVILLQPDKLNTVKLGSEWTENK